MKKYLISFIIGLALITTPVFAVTNFDKFLEWLGQETQTEQPQEPILGKANIDYKQAILPEVDGGSDIGTTTQRFNGAFNNIIIDGTCTGTGCGSGSGASYFSSLLDVATSTPATGDIYYLNSSGQIVNRGIGTPGQVLKVSGGLPIWDTDATTSGADAFSFTTNYGSATAVTSSKVWFQNSLMTSGTTNLATTIVNGSLTSNDLTLQGNTYNVSFTPSSTQTENTPYYLPIDKGLPGQMLTNVDGTQLRWKDPQIQGLVTYFDTNWTADIGGYFTQWTNQTTTTAVTVLSGDVGAGNTLFQTFITPSSTPGITTIPAGQWKYHFYALKNTAAVTRLYVEVYKRSDTGTETLLMTSSLSSPITFASEAYDVTVTTSTIPLLITDRLVTKLYINAAATVNVGHIYMGSTQGGLTLPVLFQPGFGLPGGLNTEVQFNDYGVFGGSSLFTFNKTTGNLTSGYFTGTGITSSTLAGSLILPINSHLTTDGLVGAGSSGIMLHANNWDTIATFGAGGSQNALFFGGVNINGATTLGDTTSDTITANARLASDLLPSANNTYNLGSASLLFKNSYSSYTSSTVASDLGTVLSGTWNGTAIGDAYLTKTGDWTGTIDGNNFAGGAIGIGELLYGGGAGSIAELGVGTNGNILAQLSGIPAWISTSTFLFSTGGTGTGVWDFGGATSFEIPNSANPTVDAAGEIAIDTTVASSSLKYYDGTAERALYDVIEKTFTLTTSTLDSYEGQTASSTIPIGFGSKHGETWLNAVCNTTNGTAELEFIDASSNAMNYIKLTTAVLDTTLSTNNTFVYNEPRFVRVGKVSSTGSVTCTIYIRKNAD